MKQYGLPGATAGLLGFGLARGGLRATAIPAGAHPTEAGLRVLRFTRQMIKDGAEAIVSDRADWLRVVSDDREPATPQEIFRLKRWSTEGAIEGGGFPWSVILAKTAGDPDAILLSGYMEDAAEFACDSIFCEWGYVINFQARVLEVYRGLNTQAPTAGRWVGGELDGQEALRLERCTEFGTNYYAINEVARFPFDQLPTDEAFLTHLDHWL